MRLAGVDAVPRGRGTRAADGIDVKGPDELPMQIKSGHAEMTREGDAKLTGGVTISQGDREVTAESATYDATERRFEVEGDVEFRSPELRLKGGSGSWNALGTGQFTGAEFELPQRPARGSADRARDDARGRAEAHRRALHDLPGGQHGLGAARVLASTSTSARSRARAATSASTSRASRSCTRR